MPELPEVEVARQVVEAHLVGRTVESVDAVEDDSARGRARAGGRAGGRAERAGAWRGNPAQRPGHLEPLTRHRLTSSPPYPSKEIFSAPPAALVAGLQGRTDAAARRHGKHLWLEFADGGARLMLHFGVEWVAAWVMGGRC